MRILGIDPGYGITGFGLVDAQRGQFQLLRCGVITTPPNTDFSWRLEVIYNDMVELLKVTKPDVVAIEELFFGQNVTTGIGVAQSRGVILLAIRQAGILWRLGRSCRYNEIILLKQNGSRRGYRDGGFLARNLFKIIHIPYSEAARAYIVAHYGPLDFDLSDGRPEQSQLVEAEWMEEEV